MSGVERCVHVERGCMWEGPFALLNSHLQACPFEALKNYMQEKEVEMMELRNQVQQLQIQLAQFSNESQCAHYLLNWHAEAVVSLAIHGAFIFSGSMDGMLKLASIDTLQVVREVNLGAVMTIKIAGNRMYSGHANLIRVWDLANMTLVTELPGHNGHVKIWDTNTLRCLFTVRDAHKGEVRDFAAVDDSTGMALFIFSCGDDGFIRAWNRSFVCERAVKAHKAPIRAMVSASLPGVGEFLVTGSEDTYIKVWDVGLVDPRTSLIARVPCLVGVSSLAFVPPCQLISGHTDGSIRIWSIQNPRAVRCERLLAGHSEAVRTLAIGRNCFFSGSYDNSIAAWYPSGGAPVLPTPASV